jgi:flavorubredoxin
VRAIEIKKDIYWAGVIDWDLRNFHGYLTQRGSTYNSYLILDEKITLIDNVKSYLTDEHINRISSIVDPTQIDYIIQNHIEPDHSGSLPMIKKMCPNAKIFATQKAAEGLPKHYDAEFDIQVVKTGETLDIGKRTLRFVQTPMVHWPDNMITYSPEDKILFSNDAFGQHIASSERFDDEYPLDITLREAQKYYANIVLPYSKQVKKALEVASKLDIEIICPSHGLIWRKYLAEIMQAYTKWSANESDERALIIYDTMWGSTDKIAHAIFDAFSECGVVGKMLNLQTNHISDIMTEVMDAKYLCVGSPTLNNNMMPTVSAFLTYLKGLAPKNKQALAFGSYGWSGQSVQQIENILSECGFELMPAIRTEYVPNKDMLDKIKQKIIKRKKEEI